MSRPQKNSVPAVYLQEVTARTASGQSHVSPLSRKTAPARIHHCIADPIPSMISSLPQILKWKPHLHMKCQR